MPVQKLVLQVTVMCATDSLQQAVDAYSNMSLERIHDAINFGEDIGSGVSIASSETIDDPKKVEEELRAIGNDGTFFDCELGKLTKDQNEDIEITPQDTGHPRTEAPF